MVIISRVVIIIKYNDIILLVSYVLGNLDEYNSVLFEFSGDLNSDNLVDILDILALVNIILNNN